MTKTPHCIFTPRSVFKDNARRNLSKIKILTVLYYHQAQSSGKDDARRKLPNMKVLTVLYCHHAQSSGKDNAKESYER